MQYILEQGVCHGTVFNSCHTSSTAEKNPLTEIQEGELYLCLEHRTVRVRERIINLTSKEFDILALLIANPKRVFTYELITDLVWKTSKLEEITMKKINLRDYYPYYTQDMIVEVPDEVALLLREYMLLEEAYRIRTYRYKAFYSLDRDEGIEREILQKPLNPAEIWEQRQMTELIYKGLSKLPVKQRQRIYAHFFLGMSKADIAKAEGTHKSRITRSIEAGLRSLEKYFKEIL